MSQSLELNFRAATAADYESVAALSPSGLEQWQWHAWLDDPGCVPMVAQRGAALIGAAVLVELSAVEWWIEGMRVDPRLRGHGVEQIMLAGLVETFREYGQGYLRFLVASDDEGLSSAARVHAMRHVASYGEMRAAAVDAPFESMKLLKEGNLQMADRFIRNSPLYRSNAYAEQGGRMVFMTTERLREYFSLPKLLQVLGWRHENRLAGLAVVSLLNHEHPLHIHYLSAPDDTSLSAMLTALRGLAAYRGQTSVFWTMPMNIGLEPAVERSGASIYAEPGKWLFELPVSAIIRNPMEQT